MTGSVDDRVVERQFDTERDSPAEAVAETVAELEGAETEELTPVWSVIDHMVDRLFDTPPAPEAQVEVVFSYEGYRVTVHQDGSARFVKPTTSDR